MRTMRLIHGLIKLVFGAGLIAAGVLLYMYSVSELYELFISFAPDEDQYRRIGGVVFSVAESAKEAGPSGDPARVGVRIN